MHSRELETECSKLARFIKLVIEWMDLNKLLGHFNLL